MFASLCGKRAVDAEILDRVASWLRAFRESRCSFRDEATHTILGNALCLETMHGLEPSVAKRLHERPLPASGVCGCRRRMLQVVAGDIEAVVLPPGCEPLMVESEQRVKELLAAAEPSRRLAVLAS